MLIHLPTFLLSNRLARKITEQLHEDFIEVN